MRGRDSSRISTAGEGIGDAGPGVPGRLVSFPHLWGGLLLHPVRMGQRRKLLFPEWLEFITNSIGHL